MSQIRATTISDLAGTGPATLTGQSAAKAWGRVNGAATPTLADTFNIASLVDSGVGIYTLNLTNAMSGTASGAFGSNLQAGINTGITTPTASSFALTNRQSSDGTSAFDGNCAGAVLGDLA